MPTGTVAHIAPDVLTWARESAGYSRRAAADAIGIETWRLEAAETDQDLLTLREAEEAARVYDRPLSDLFLPSPPAEEPQEMQFRRLPGTPEPPWPPAMQLLARKIMDRQAAGLELYDAIDEQPPWPAESETFTSAKRGKLAQLTRDTLGVTEDDQASWHPDKYAPLREWRAAIEDLGILVMQDGAIELDQARGFASVQPAELPAILVNNADDPRARAFTLLHEFGHILLAARGESTGPVTETWCNEFAGDVLLPQPWLAAELKGLEGATPTKRAEAIAETFSVTPLAAAVRIARSGLVPRAEADEATRTIRSRWKGETRGSTSGSYYRNQISWFGPGYIRLVFSALDGQAVTLPTASNLLGGVRVSNFAKLRDYVEGYT